MKIIPADVIAFWFGNDSERPLMNKALWWKKDEHFDNEIREKFEETLSLAAHGELDFWLDSPDGTLAFIVLLDQFSRNIYRGTAKAFARDAQALRVAQDGIRKGFDTKLPLTYRIFFYLPFEHAEDLEMQNKSIALYGNLAKEADDNLKETLQSNLDYAHAHRNIIKRFGRYPHRNKILGRENTPQETEFLQQPNSSF